MTVIPCQRFTDQRPQVRDKQDEVYVDQLSVDICLNCTLPECHGAKAADRSGHSRPPRCPYEAAIMERKKPRVYVLPPPRPDGAMVAWECEVG